MVANFFAANFTFGEQGGDLVGVFDALGVNAQQIASGDDFFQREVLGVNQVERIGRSHSALGHIVGGDCHVLNFNAGGFFEFFCDFFILVHRSAQITQDYFFIGVHGWKDAACQNGSSPFQNRTTICSDCFDRLFHFFHGLP